MIAARPVGSVALLLMMWLLLVSQIVVDQIAPIVPGVQKIGAVWPLPGLRRSTNTSRGCAPHGSRSWDWHHLWRLLEAAVVVVCSCHSKLLLLLCRNQNQICPW